jgi:hypothetical protein
MLFGISQFMKDYLIYNLFIEIVYNGRYISCFKQMVFLLTSIPKSSIADKINDLFLVYFRVCNTFWNHFSTIISLYKCIIRYMLAKENAY